MLRKYQEKLNLVVVLIFLLLFLGGMTIMRHSASRVASFYGSQVILDLRMGYSVGECQDYLASLGEEGRSEYADHFFYVDLGYMIIYNAFYFSALLYLIKLIRPKARWGGRILFLPVFGFIFDLGENLLIRRMIRNFPDISSATCHIASICTVSKFLCVCSALAFVCVSSIFLLCKAFRQRKRY